MNNLKGDGGAFSVPSLKFQRKLVDSVARINLTRKLQFVESFAKKLRNCLAFYYLPYDPNRQTETSDLYVNDRNTVT